MHKRNHLRVYIPGPAFDEMMAEAKRLERSLSYVLRVAWRTARDAVRAMEPTNGGRRGRGTPRT